MKKQPILIIDGNLYAYRSYYTFPHCTNISGQPAGVIYGTLKMIQYLLQKYDHTKKIIIIFDSSKNTFRKKIYPDYKKNRLPMPTSLAIQITSLIQEIHKIGIQTLSIPGIEADDIIGSLAHKLENNGEKVLIISHDKDMLQLVTQNINVLQKNNQGVIKPCQIKKKYGIQPKEFIDLLALMGDASDNIPGIPKIGQKTALFLLNQFYNIKNIYQNINKIEKLSFRNSKNILIELKENQDKAFLSYKLAEIQLNLDINITLKEICINKFYMKNLFYILKQFKLNTL